MIRRGGSEDLEQVYLLNCEAFTEHWSFEGLVQSLQQGFDLHLCTAGDELAGYILSQDILDEVHIMQVAVAQAFRRQGVAERLSLFLMRQKADAQCFMLEVRASNTAAQALYGKLGFRHVGRRVGYYVPGSHDGEREDALLMRLDRTVE